MRAWLRRSDLTSWMISSLSFRICAPARGESFSLLSLFWMSSSCRRRSRLKVSAMVSKVSSTLGLSSASMAASDIEFSRSSSSISASPSALLGRLLAVASLRPLRLERRRGRRRRRRRHRLRRLRPQSPGTPAAAARRGWPPSPGRPGRPAPPLLGVGTGIGRFEIDDVAQEDFSFVEFVAPDDDRLEGKRALAQARRSSPRGRPRCAWRSRSRPRGRAARPSPSRADTSAPDRRCARPAPWLRILAGVFGVTSTSSPRSVSSSSGSSRALPRRLRLPRSRPTLMPISLIIASTSSICSEVTSSEGITELSCS